MDSKPHDEFVEELLKNQRPLYAYIASLLPNGDDADEVYQQTCLILWQKWEQFDHEKEFLSLACGVAYNELRNYLRKKDRRPITLSEDVLEQLSERRLEQQHVRTRRGVAVSHCLGELPDNERTLIEEIYATKKPVKDVADERGVSAGSLYTRAHRIRKRLMECVDRVVAREESL